MTSSTNFIERGVFPLEEFEQTMVTVQKRDPETSERYTIRVPLREAFVTHSKLWEIVLALRAEDDRAFRSSLARDVILTSAYRGGITKVYTTKNGTCSVNVSLAQIVDKLYDLGTRTQDSYVWVFGKNFFRDARKCSTEEAPFLFGQQDLFKSLGSASTALLVKALRFFLFEALCQFLRRHESGESDFDAKTKKYRPKWRAESATFSVGDENGRRVTNDTFIGFVDTLLWCHDMLAFFSPELSEFVELARVAGEAGRAEYQAKQEERQKARAVTQANRSLRAAGIPEEEVDENCFVNPQVVMRQPIKPVGSSSAWTKPFLQPSQPAKPEEQPSAEPADDPVAKPTRVPRGKHTKK